MLILPSVVVFLSNGKLIITLGEQIIIGICLFIAISFVEFLYFYNQSLQHTKQEHKFWEIKSTGDNELYNIRTNFHKVVQDAKDENDIFVLHFMKEFKKLSNNIVEVAEKKELYVTADYFLNTDNVLNAFSNPDDSFWHYTWQINNADEELFDKEAWCLYFEKTPKFVQTKKMKHIKAILIFPDLSFVEHPRISKLLAFFKTNNDITCKIISLKRFTNILNQNSFSGTDDFGIYGSSLLYIEKYVGSEAAGFFIKDKQRINNYGNLFNQLWDSDSMTLPNPSKETIKVEVTSLINFDKTYKHE